MGSAVGSPAISVQRSSPSVTSAPWHLTFLADVVSERLDLVDDDARLAIEGAARMHPGRWRFVLRDRVASARTGEGLQAARLLEAIGEQSDILRLRTFARRQGRGRSVPVSGGLLRNGWQFGSSCTTRIE